MSKLPNKMPSFWRGKRVLVSGHTGFKGSWLALWLHRLGAEVHGVSLPPATSPSLYDLAEIGQCSRGHFCDIRDPSALAEVIKTSRPEIIFHLAAQSLVRAGYGRPQETFATNVMGTVNVLDALRESDGIRVAVMVTTDKVYRNNEWHYPYREDDALGGHDPYSASKAASEIAIASYRDAFLSSLGIAVASARAGNVIGGGDWSEDRLIPDLMRAWQSGKVLEIRNPLAIRPWQHVLEPLAGYLILAEKLWQQPELAGAYNFGPHSHDAATVFEVVELARIAYGSGEVACTAGDKGPHEAGCLALETAKARFSLGIVPKWDLKETVTRAMTWYRRQHDGIAARSLCEAEIAAYETLL